MKKNKQGIQDLNSLPSRRKVQLQPAPRGVFKDEPEQTDDEVVNDMLRHYRRLSN